MSVAIKVGQFPLESISRDNVCEVNRSMPSATGPRHLEWELGRQRVSVGKLANANEGTQEQRGTLRSSLSAVNRKVFHGDGRHTCLCSGNQTYCLAHNELTRPRDGCISSGIVVV